MTVTEHTRRTPPFRKGGDNVLVEALADETDSLAGLLLSVFDERVELARDAELRRMGL